MSSDPDKALVRTVDDGKINLAVGEPFFLRRAMARLMVEAPASSRRRNAMMSYPPHRGIPELLELLEGGGEKVVITNGAKQALLAAMYAFKQRGYSGVYHEAPHWPTYPTLAKLSSLTFDTEDPTRFSYTAPKSIIRVITSPNNPDGAQLSDMALVQSRCEIWDAAYATEVYGWNRIEPNHEVSVWSAAKLLGLSGYRVGWLYTRDDELADAAADYVEKTTSGVNVAAQYKVADVIRWMRGNPHDADRAYEEARAVLLKNTGLFKARVSKFCEKHNACGMFAWFKPKNQLRFEEALELAHIVLVKGEACGATEPGWYRMSLGLEAGPFEQAMDQLTGALYQVR